VKLGPKILIVRGLRVIIRGSLKCMVGNADDETLAAFGQRVRDIRAKMGLSQEGLAEKCDLDRSYIGGVERGERNVSLINIKRIAHALGVSAREFFEPL
jgi:ribosome-binding protein aMBF1 (putative translation factor)